MVLDLWGYHEMVSDKSFLESHITHDAPSKYGPRHTRGKKYTSSVKELAEAQYTKDTTKKRKFYVGMVLRVETNTVGDSSWPFEPGSLMTKKYRGETAPQLVAIKVRIPEIHAMLPVPNQLGSEPCSDKDTVKKCHHPIIDLYPTFYAETSDLPTPDPGELVRVTFRNFNAGTDPIYISSETKYFAPTVATTGGARSYGVGRGGGGGGIPGGGANIPAATCGSYPRVPVVVRNAQMRDQFYGAPCKGKRANVNFRNRKIPVNPAAAAAFEMVEADIAMCQEAQNYKFYQGLPGPGTYACRCMRHQGTFPNDCKIGISNHAWGTAIDINPAQNPAKQGVLIYDLPECVIAAFKRYGFSWGGDWKGYVDSMHFEFKGDPSVAESARSSKQSYDGNPYCKGRPGPPKRESGTSTPSSGAKFVPRGRCATSPIFNFSQPRFIGRGETQPYGWKKTGEFMRVKTHPDPCAKLFIATVSKKAQAGFHLRNMVRRRLQSDVGQEHGWIEVEVSGIHMAATITTHTTSGKTGKRIAPTPGLELYWKKSNEITYNKTSSPNASSVKA